MMIRSLAGDPRWRAFYAGITGLLNRDSTALSRAFNVELTQLPDSWTLELRPRASGKNVVTRISASGAGARLLRLRIEQGESEWQEMTFPRTGS